MSLDTVNAKITSPPLQDTIPPSIPPAPQPAGICCYDYRKNKKHQIKLSGVPFHEFLPLARLITSGHFYHL